MAPTVSLKPIATLIRNTENKLRTLNRKSPPAQKKKIDRKIKELNLILRRLSQLCHGWGIVVKPKK